MERRSIYPVSLEIRAEGRTLSGAFRYGSLATLPSRGRMRKETFGPDAFGAAIREAAAGRREISLLSGHSMGKPLAGTRAGSLTLTSDAETLAFVAMLPEEPEQTEAMRDVVKMMRADLVGGISPGFVVPPKSTVPGAEEEISGNDGATIRRINQAVLFELSLVHRPAYADSTAELRGETVDLRRRRVWL